MPCMAYTRILAYPPEEFCGIIRLKIDPPFLAIVLHALQQVFARFTTPEEFRGTLIIAEAETMRVWKTEETP